MDEWCDGWVVVMVDSLVLDGGFHSDDGVASLPVVEGIEVFVDGVWPTRSGFATASRPASLCQAFP